MMNTKQTSAGLMVLGMHRSGTSALAHALQLAGADAGARVVGASRGNEAGHWEDAFAVELHERMLSRFGARWDEPYALPGDWMEHAAARTAEASITRYLADDRALLPAWSVKDPRLSIFGALWTRAAAAAGVDLSMIVLLRHPLEVASSLARRDGIGRGTALLLWAEHTLSALRLCAGRASLVLRYDDLLDRWDDCAAAIAYLPGARHLDFQGAREEILRTLDPGQRHHRGDGGEALPSYIARLWAGLQPMALRAVDPAAAAGLAPELDALQELLQLHADDAREQRARLWERIAQADGMPAPEVVRALPGELEELRNRLDRHHADLVAAFSGDVQAMQAEHAAAIAAAARADGEAAVARGLADRLDAITTGMDNQHAAVVEAISTEIRAMQAATAAAHESARQQAVEADRARARAESMERDLAELRRVAGLGEVAAEASLRDLAEVVEHARARAEALEQDVERARHATGVAEEARLATARELAVANEELARLREAAATLHTVMGSRSWRWTRPMRVVARALRGDWKPEDGQALRRALLGWAARSPAIPGEVKRGRLAPALREAHGATPIPEREAAGVGIAPAPQHPELHDVFFWSVIDWHFRTQRPQHLARALAGKGHRVFYMSNNFVDSREPGFSLSPLDDDGRLFQVHLHLAGAPAIYAAAPGADDLRQLQASLAELLAWTRSVASISIVQHPYWKSLATMVPSPRLVYDCMDHHAGFENNGSEILDAEAALIAKADLVVVTSDPLQADVAGNARSTAVIRNAADFDFFERRPDAVYVADGGVPVIGYYGAIAEWFDTSLVRRVAERHPDAEVVLVGDDTAGAGKALADLPNVRLVGEVPYTALPYWLHAFDVCLLPFKRNALTHATNPVKVYEYLAAGKPVVSVDLPEMAQFGRLVEVADDADGFARAVGAALSRPGGGAESSARKAFARSQTWADRASQLDAELRRLADRPVSVVVLTYNNLEYTQACLASIEAHSDYGNLEVVVVDNASTDGSREWLREWAGRPGAAGHRKRLILNDGNLGFAAGNNVGLRACDGDVLVVLNNDTYVTPGWVRTLCAHLARDPGLGLVGPVTNNIGNEARIEIEYASMEEMIAKAGALARSRPGGEIALATAAFFCVAMPRRVFEHVGGLDEGFGMGFFEDDDYCRRVEQAGYRIACAEDVFVHHHLSASFNKIPTAERQALFERNKARYEEKWGTWTPHEYRTDAPAS